jgi:adenylate kinase family enzyme
VVRNRATYLTRSISRILREICKQKGGSEVLARAIAIIGPPAAGKTSLTMRLAELPGRRVFRLREHVPHAILAATATDAQRLGWIDDFTVITSVHEYVETAIRQGEIHTLLLDNFPGTGTQVSLFLSVLRQLAPSCTVSAVELMADPMVLRRRASSRRVCHYCERDPLCDPRLPAEASSADPDRCARCDHLLDMRRGDEPAVYKTRMQRYQQVAEGIRHAFAGAGIAVTQLNSSHSLNSAALELTALLTPKEQ